MTIAVERFADLSARTVGSGDPVVFIHGFPLDARMWDDQLVRLPAGFRGVAVDLRGFGRSPETISAPVSMESHADDVAAVIDQLGGTAHVVGLSMGGYVALALLEHHADIVRSLVLADSKSAADTPEGRAGRDAAVTKLLADGRSAFIAGMIPNLVAPGVSAEVHARLLTMGEATPYESIVAALTGMRDRPDRSDVLGSAEVPVTVIVGEVDAISPPDVAAAMADSVAEGALEVIAKAGHMAPMEAPDDVAAALGRHLDRCGA